MPKKDAQGCLRRMHKDAQEGCTRMHKKDAQGCTFGAATMACAHSAALTVSARLRSHCRRLSRSLTSARRKIRCPSFNLREQGLRPAADETPRSANTASVEVRFRKVVAAWRWVAEAARPTPSASRRAGYIVLSRAASCKTRPGAALSTPASQRLRGRGHPLDGCPEVDVSRLQLQ